MRRLLCQTLAHDDSVVVCTSTSDGVRRWYVRVAPSASRYATRLREPARDGRREWPDEADRAVCATGGCDWLVRTRRYDGARLRLLAKRAGDALERVQLGLRVARQLEAVRGMDGSRDGWLAATDGVVVT